MNIKYYFGGFAQYATFDGRASRAEFWTFTLINLFISLITPLIDQALQTYSPDGQYGIFNIGYRLLAFLPSLAVGFRRMHDAGKSGANYIVPIWNLILALRDSEPGENEYGPNPYGIQSETEDDLIRQIGDGK
jgi:uncharacterized membrane protein YhaH (DUF805 family)